MAQMIPLEIESIAAGGDGVGRNSGLVVFVPRTAPGDLITARVNGRGTFARGALRTIARASEERIEPPCAHYTRDRCGGCQIQHLAYPAQLRAKQRIIRDAVERIGKTPIALPEIRASDGEWRYRVKLSLAIERPSEGQWVAGLHPYDEPGKVFALADCLITDRRVLSAWGEVMSHSQLFPNVKSLRGSVLLTNDGPVFMLAGGTRWSGAHEFFEQTRSLAAAWWENEEGSKRLVGDRRPPRALHPPAMSFAQVNPDVTAELRAHLLKTISAYAPSTVIDAYSGAGDTAIAFAKMGARVTAIELDNDAARWCALRLPEGSVSLRARVEEALSGALPADAVVLNPPRAGTDTRVTDLLERTPLKPRVIAYVSCNPATLARDLARLPAYRIASLVAFDMFPQTAHVETVCELVPRAS